MIHIHNLTILFLVGSLDGGPNRDCVPEDLVGHCPSEPPPSAQHFSIVWPIFLHFRLVQCGQFLTVLPFWGCLELEILSGALPCLATKAVALFWLFLHFSSWSICIIRVLLTN